MKKLTLFVCSVLFVVMWSGTVGATLFFSDSPQPKDLYDLSHGYHYTWGMTWDIGDLTITDASLTIKNIQNWRQEDNDILRIYLLDSPPSLGTRVYRDAHWGNYDDIAPRTNWGPSLFATWTDPDDNGSSDTLTYTFNESQLNVLNSFVSNDNKFGFAFDPDCHYNNCGIEFNATAAPEPATMLLLGSGLIGLAGFGKKFRKQV